MRNSLAPFVQALGRGPSKSRHLSAEEAEAAMGIVLRGEAAAEAVGALLMLWRYRSENADKIAGIVRAIRGRLGDWRELAPDLDWPSYAAGRTRGLPWFLLAAKLVATAGYKVVIHGKNSHQAQALPPALAALGITQALSPTAARAALATPMGRGGIAYIPLAALDIRLEDLLALRDVLGLRSPVNTALRALDPCGARVSVQGVFHPPYRELQQESAKALGAQEMLVLKGGGGEFERLPNKPVEVMGLQKGEAFEMVAPAAQGQALRLAELGEGRIEALTELWRGTWAEPAAEAVVLGTAALALMALEACSLPEAEARAKALWAARDRAL